MRRILWGFLFFLILTSMAAIGSFVGLSIVGPFHPGEGNFYSAQRWVEQTLVDLDRRPEGKAHRLIVIAERRTRDLAALSGTPQEQLALEDMEQSILQAVNACVQADPNDSSALRGQLLQVLEKSHTVMLGLKSVSSQSSSHLAAFWDWLTLVTRLVQNSNLPLGALIQSASANLPAPGQLHSTANQSLPARPTQTPAGITPQPVTFPPGSQGAEHAFFPLTGQHARLSCFTCHPGGKYVGTPNLCSDCHAQSLPSGHYPGECSLCHNSVDWKEASFDHSLALAADCRSCHTGEQPSGHYNAQCSACHSNQAWKPATFNHGAVSATDCQACHSKIQPANHYSAQCSACHSDNAWKPAAFNHAAVGATDCQACHSKIQPANHYNAQCSACHNSSAWKPANFNHAAIGATDCQSCHSSSKPANHYSAQCSACHGASAWKPASFNHAAVSATDCQACHGGSKPANHYNGQCSACHNTNAWKPASFNHAAAGATDCQACHGGTKPANHYDGQCSSCHNTTSWQQASFSHTFPQNHGGANSQCSTCHPSGTGTWTCFNCHKQDDINNRHHSISGYTTNCIACHPKAKGSD